MTAGGCPNNNHQRDFLSKTVFPGRFALIVISRNDMK
jgi:hypothetical protein